MNISIKLNSVEIVDKVLSYTRTLDICSGIGTLELIAQYDNDFAVDPWDLVEVYEDGDKVGEFYVSMFDKSNDSGEKKVSCQDGSKKLVDWFIDQNYELRTPSYAKYWIELFLNAAGVPYTINALGSGGVLSENSSLGTTSAYDAIQGLLQMSGWYMYFNANGVCIIDTLSKDLSDALYTVTDSQIISVEIKKSDKDLRNRAVVWGNYSGGSWAFASRQVKTGYETSAYDWRTVVLANSTIYSAGTAASLAIKLLNEFANISIEKVVTLAGYHPVTIGDLLNVDSNYYTGVGLITNYQVIVDPSGGVRTVITLDVRCSRLFAYYGFITWVYTGTQGSGVYRKRLDSATWQDYSTGLAHYNVTDLMIKNSVFACIADGHCYVNLSHYIANWQVFSPGTLTDSNGVNFVFSTTKAVKVDIDETNNWISIGYELTDAAIATFGENRAWTVIIDPKRNIQASYPIVIASTGVTDLHLTDVEKYAGRDLVAVVVSGGAPPDPSLDSTWGYKRTHPLGIRDDESHIYSTANDGTTYSGADILAGPAFAHNLTQDTIFYGRRSISFDRSNFQYTAWSGDTPFTLAVPVPSFTVPAGHTTLDTSVYWMNELDGTGSPRAEEDRLYVVNFLTGDNSPYEVKFTSKTFTPVLSGYPYRLGDVSCVADAQTSLFGTYSIDGVTFGVGDRVLVANQTDASENGVYVANMGAWARALDTLDRCATFVVASGTAYAISTWQVATDDPIIDVTNIDINRVLIPSTVVNGYTIGNSVSYPIMNIDHVPLIINGVFYWTYTTQDTSFGVYPKTAAVRMFKYNCETGSYVNVSTLSHIENYANTWSNVILTVPCGLGVAQVVLEAKAHKTGATTEDELLERSRHMTLYFIKHTATTFDTSTFTLATGSATNFFDSNCYLDYDWGPEGTTGGIALRYQGCMIIGGLYHPYVKMRAKLGRQEGYRKYDSLGNCLPACFVLDPLTGGSSTFVTHRELVIRIYDVYTNSAVVSESTFQTYDFQVTTTAEDCDTTVVDAYSFVKIVDTLDFTEFNYGYNDIYRPIYTKDGSYPVFVTNNTTVMNGSQKESTLSTLSPANKVLSQIADDEGYLYVADPVNKTVYKEAQTGGIKSTFILPTTPSYQNNFAYTNELFIFDNSIDATEYTIKYKPSNSQIYKLSDDIIVTFSGGAASYILERNNSNTFDIIDTDEYALNLEASVDWPLISRTYGAKLGTGADTPHFRMFTTYPLYIEGSGLLADARGFFAGGDIMEFEAGDVDIQYSKYGLILNSGGSMQIVDSSSLTDGNTRYGVYTLSGTHLAIETSNHYFPNYMFISSENSFFQRNPVYSTTFLNHSSGMPVDYINIIRLDDRV